MYVCVCVTDWRVCNAAQNNLPEAIPVISLNFPPSQSLFSLFLLNHPFSPAGATSKSVCYQCWELCVCACACVRDIPQLISERSRPRPGSSLTLLAEIYQYRKREWNKTNLNRVQTSGSRKALRDFILTHFQQLQHNLRVNKCLKDQYIRNELKIFREIYHRKGSHIIYSRCCRE